MVHEDEEKRSRMRKCVVDELIDTEINFVGDLDFLLNAYIIPLKERKMLSTHDWQTISGNIYQLYELHALFLKNLHETISKQPDTEQQQIGAVFLQDLEQFKAYATYCINHPNALRVILVLGKNEEFRSYQKDLIIDMMKRKELQDKTDTGGTYIPNGLITIESMLLKPLQRVTKYPLLLRELLKFTSTTHRDYKYIEAAKEGMEEVNKYINEKKRKIEGMQDLIELQKSIANWTGPTLIGSGDLIQQGALRFKEATIPHAKARKVLVVLLTKRLVLLDIKKKGYDFISSHAIRDLRWKKMGANYEEGWQISYANMSATAIIFQFCAKNDEQHQLWSGEMMKIIRSNSNRQTFRRPISLKPKIAHQLSSGRKTSLLPGMEELNEKLANKKIMTENLMLVSGTDLPDLEMTQGVNETKKRFMTLARDQNTGNPQDSFRHRRQFQGTSFNGRAVHSPNNVKKTPPPKPTRDTSRKFSGTSRSSSSGRLIVATKRTSQNSIKSITSETSDDEDDRAKHRFSIIDNSITEAIEADISRLARAFAAENVCTACEDAIDDIHLAIQTPAGTFHSKCFTCDECQCLVGGKFFIHENRALCERDFAKLKLCGKCQEPLQGPIILVENTISYHKNCFCCKVCDVSLLTAGALVSKEQSGIWCQQHYQDLFGTKCYTCRRLITGPVSQALGKSWHVDCFSCSFQGCSEDITTKFYSHNELPYCRLHHSILAGYVCDVCEDPILGSYRYVGMVKYHERCFSKKYPEYA